MAGSPEARAAKRAFSSAFSTKVRPVSAADSGCELCERAHVGLPRREDLAHLAQLAGVAGGQDEARGNAHQASARLASRRSFRNHRERGLQRFDLHGEELLA